MRLINLHYQIKFIAFAAASNDLPFFSMPAPRESRPGGYISTSRVLCGRGSFFCPLRCLFFE